MTDTLYSTNTYISSLPFWLQFNIKEICYKIYGKYYTEEETRNIIENIKHSKFSNMDFDGIYLTDSMYYSWLNGQEVYIYDIMVDLDWTATVATNLSVTKATMIIRKWYKEIYANDLEEDIPLHKYAISNGGYMDLLEL